MATRDEWLAALLEPLTPAQVSARMADDNPHWEFIDGEMVKLGALSHGTLDVKSVQQRIVQLLASETKDFRLVVHLLRTLQHAGKPPEVVLALRLLCAWVNAWWLEAWPTNEVMKRRLAQQVIKRFAAAATPFVEHATAAERDAALGELAHLAQLWQASEKPLAAEADALSAAFRRQPARVETLPEQPQPAAGGGGAADITSAAPFPALDVDASDDKAWRQSQLQMAGILCERQVANPLGYRLRRNAIWHGITSAPLAQADGRTPLAAFSADRMAEYHAALSSADAALWEQVEQSLTLAPYWFDGHRLSADIAARLGHMRVAEAICEELQLFLQRLPALEALLFTDRTPFLSADTRAWLAVSDAQTATAPSSLPGGADREAVWQCWQQQGLDAALAMIDAAAAQQNPRGQFYCQLLGTQLLDEAGLTTLAQQGYHQLALVAGSLTLSAWEPELIAQLQDHQRSSQG